MIETYRGVVYLQHLDHMGHMNVQWYAQKFDEATWSLFSYLDITSTYLQDNNKGMAAVEQYTRYKKEALVGDILVVKSKVLEMNEKAVRFLHVMYNVETNQELATSELIGVHIDRKTRKSCPFPDDIYKKGIEFASRE